MDVNEMLQEMHMLVTMHTRPVLFLQVLLLPLELLSGIVIRQIISNSDVLRSVEVEV